MRKHLAIIGSLAALAVAAIIALFVPVFSFIILETVTPPCFATTSYRIARMAWIISRGEMAWDDEVEKAYKHLRQCKSDKRLLAAQLFSHEDGTIASLGMDLVVQESFEDGDHILMQFHNDKRWNHNLALNDEYSQLLLAMWKIRRTIPLNAQDKEVVERWPDTYFERLGVIPPERSDS